MDTNRRLAKHAARRGQGNSFRVGSRDSGAISRRFSGFVFIRVHSWFPKVWPGAGGRSPTAGEALVASRKAAFELRARGSRRPRPLGVGVEPTFIPFGFGPSAIFSRVLDPANAQDHACDAGRLLVWSKV